MKRNIWKLLEESKKKHKGKRLNDIPTTEISLEEFIELYKPRLEYWHKFRSTCPTAGNCYDWWASRINEDFWEPLGPYRTLNVKFKGFTNKWYEEPKHLIGLIEVFRNLFYPDHVDSNAIFNQTHIPLDIKLEKPIQLELL